MWDTGSKVSVISEVFIRQNFPEVQIRDISELLQTDLKLTAANGSDIPYHGWAEINFQVTPRSPVLTVPFLVRQETSDSMVITPLKKAFTLILQTQKLLAPPSDIPVADLGHK